MELEFALYVFIGLVTIMVASMVYTAVCFYRLSKSMKTKK
ncbi:hypothetical protein IJ22_18590 [Paenibacillus naphthalenovorans]|uniref:Uncharacterized protein n=1 Tax=Paenibacillus naphthalenovorans TaxID=162209 RepID=A0A0U2U785_9BACL|nr:hypothetical protein IJ22_18590 [Paenibacillus naphthalenovorans]